MFSMTGFGSAEVACSELQLSLTLRSVNGRFFDCHVHLPREWLELEPAVKQAVRERIRRGRVDVFVDRKGVSPNEFRVVEEVAAGYVAAGRRLIELGAAGPLSVGDLLALPGVVAQEPPALEQIREPLLEALAVALERLVESRAKEGQALREILTDHLDRLEQRVEAISNHAQGLLEYHRSRLMERLAELQREVRIDEARLAQEVLFYAEKSDISEELNRLRTHVARFRQLLDEGEQDSVGRDLDFLCQELNREVNTILSKAAVVEISELAVEAKSEVERLREQVQNVE
ncbi:MAG: YicC family protein [Acidobacteriota bacterium]